MDQHDFIFKEGVWIGEGKLKFSTSPEEIHFYTKWTLKILDKNERKWTQEVELRGGGDPVFNHFTFSAFQKEHFLISLENDVLGKATGKGFFDEKKIAWEFREKRNSIDDIQGDFEGFEVYELQENGDYLLHAEYVSTDEHRTTIDGRIWKKNK